MFKLDYIQGSKNGLNIENKGTPDKAPSDNVSAANYPSNEKEQRRKRLLNEINRKVMQNSL